MKIDLVYTWVDGNDPTWQAKRARKLHGGIMPEATNKARSYDNEELRFSLRSVEKFAPWISHVYIVTDQQTPSWLNSYNPKVSVIDQADIIPPEYSPVFNSVVIEWFLDCIPGLSEHYIYANDDMFFGNFVSEEDFFNSNGNPIVYIRRQDKKRDSLYENHIHNAFFCISSLTGNKTGIFHPSHVMDSYRKSFVKEVKKIFHDELKNTYKNNFRTAHDIHRVLIPAYDNLIRRNTLKYGNPRNVIEKLYKKRVYRSVGLSSDFDRSIQKLLKERPLMFCLNDQEITTDDIRIKSKLFCENYFPVASCFERQLNDEEMPTDKAGLESIE